MLITVDPHSGVPVYRQVIDQIKLHIATGRLEEGAELPSTRALSAELKVNPMTLSKAYSRLEQEGFITRRPGLPSIVAARTSDDQETSQIALLRQQLEPAVALVARLGLSPDRALGVLGAMLADIENKGDKS